MVGETRGVLDEGWVTLVDMLPHEGSADMTVVNAARVSFGAKGKGEEQDKRLLRYLVKHRHTSPFEHVVFSFEVNAPVLVWWQWVRHRTWSYNFQSGRYTDFLDEQIHNPSRWRAQSSSNRQASEGEVGDVLNAELNERWAIAMHDAWDNYRYALRQGVAREQARLFLPGFAMYYKAICTVDLHNLLHFLSLRSGDEAQWEIRQYAEAIRSLVMPTIPWIAQAMEGME